jgi:GH24 family phage-related lysozyme (muramidase)|tara:strand:- start:438 stop:1436 length:999 start_codon:yes stop_codon:yes gene_type:complete
MFVPSDETVASAVRIQAPELRTFSEHPKPMSAIPSHSAPDRQKPSRTPSDSADRVRRMLQDLDMPLDGLPTNRVPEADRRLAAARRERERRIEQQQRNDLSRARRAASKVFGVKPSKSSRKAATAMLTAGAVGLAAFTNPFGPSRPFGGTADTHEVFEDPTQSRLAAHKIGTSAEFKRALIEEEGVRYIVYRDVAGYPTVGVGHLIDPQDGLRVGDRVSKQQILEFLEIDLAEAERHVRELVGDLPLYQHEFDALVDLVYNVGPGNVAEDESPRLNAAIQARDYDAIAAELNYTHAAGQVARGLEFRSERREKMFSEASYEDPRESAARSTV